MLLKGFPCLPGNEAGVARHIHLERFKSRALEFGGLRVLGFWGLSALGFRGFGV